MEFPLVSFLLSLRGREEAVLLSMNPTEKVLGTVFRFRSQNLRPHRRRRVDLRAVSQARRTWNPGGEVNEAGREGKRINKEPWYRLPFIGYWD